MVNVCLSVCVYHCVQKLDASLQFSSGLTIKTEEKPSDRLFLTDANIVPLCRNKKHTHFKTQPFETQIDKQVSTQTRTNAVSQLSALAYMGEAKDLLPFFAPAFPLSSSTCGEREKQDVKMLQRKNLVKLSTFIFISEKQMNA